MRVFMQDGMPILRDKAMRTPISRTGLYAITLLFFLQPEVLSAPTNVQGKDNTVIDESIHAGRDANVRKGPSKKEVRAAIRKELTPIIKMLNAIRDLISKAESEHSTEVSHGDILLTRSLNDKVVADNTTKTNGRLNETALTTEALITKVNSEKGTLLKPLSTNPTLYNNLSRTLSSLDSVLVDLKNKPRRHVKFTLF